MTTIGHTTKPADARRRRAARIFAAAVAAATLVVIAVNDDDTSNPGSGDIFQQNALDQSTA